MGGLDPRKARDRDEEAARIKALSFFPINRYFGSHLPIDYRNQRLSIDTYCPDRYLKLYRQISQGSLFLLLIPVVDLFGLIILVGGGCWCSAAPKSYAMKKKDSTFKFLANSVSVNGGWNWWSQKSNKGQFHCDDWYLQVRLLIETQFFMPVASVVGLSVVVCFRHE
ncbi:hypothetical protein L6452_11956 [Arctium lappa]|uniref:Uncharacterized protein n=1 Tax=Arctium lappa TaxID=4217 RepID=A0ACB9DPT7_ARCLA|nr:hypothetical protein L6452_11956 [Arctium lappa]